MELIVKLRNEEELRFVQEVLNRMKIKNELREVNLKKKRTRAFLDSLPARAEQVNQAMRGEIKLKNAFDLLDEL